MATTDDDLVARVVERALAAQTRMMLAYMESLRSTLHGEIEAAVRSEFAGDQVYVCKRKSTALSEATLASMRADREAGMTTRAIARKYRISKSSAARLCKGEESDA